MLPEQFGGDLIQNFLGRRVHDRNDLLGGEGRLEEALVDLLVDAVGEGSRDVDVRLQVHAFLAQLEGLFRSLHVDGDGGF